MVFLVEYVRGDVRSQVGGNLRKIRAGGNKTCVYQIPEDEAYRLPLLKSLIEIRNDNWSVIFNEEKGGEERDEEFEDNDIITMINDVCSS